MSYIQIFFITIAANLYVITSANDLIAAETGKGGIGVVAGAKGGKFGKSGAAGAFAKGGGAAGFGAKKFGKKGKKIEKQMLKISLLKLLLF